MVLSTKVQGGMTAAARLLRSERRTASRSGLRPRRARPELSTGTVLSNVKLTMRQQDTVAFYAGTYEIVPQEDRAA